MSRKFTGENPRFISRRPDSPKSAINRQESRGSGRGRGRGRGLFRGGFEDSRRTIDSRPHVQQRIDVRDRIIQNNEPNHHHYHHHHHNQHDHQDHRASFDGTSLPMNDRPQRHESRFGIVQRRPAPIDAKRDGQRSALSGMNYCGEPFDFSPNSNDPGVQCEDSASDMFAKRCTNKRNCWAHFRSAWNINRSKFFTISNHTTFTLHIIITPMCQRKVDPHIRNPCKFLVPPLSSFRPSEHTLEVKQVVAAGAARISIVAKLGPNQTCYVLTEPFFNNNSTFVVCEKRFLGENMDVSNSINLKHNPFAVFIEYPDHFEPHGDRNISRTMYDELVNYVKGKNIRHPSFAQFRECVYQYYLKTNRILEWQCSAIWKLWAFYKLPLVDFRLPFKPVWDAKYELEFI